MYCDKLYPTPSKAAHASASTSPIEIYSQHNPQDYLSEYRSISQLYHAAAEAPNLSAPTNPWMLIHWPFLNYENNIVKILREQDVDIRDKVAVHDYAHLGIRLYDFTTTNPENFDTWGWYAISRAVPHAIGDKAMVLTFNNTFRSPEAYEQLVEAKREIRRQLGHVSFRLVWNGETFVTNYRACHAPDYPNVTTEWNFVQDHTFQTDSLSPTRVMSEYFTPTANSTVWRNKEAARDYNPLKPSLVVLTGASGAGKDTLLSRLVEKGLAIEIKSATTRPRRMEESDKEAEDKYVWMRSRRTNETTKEYGQRLRDEYALVEYGYHNGHYYGVPRQSMDEFIQTNSSKPGVVVTDIAGARRIKTAFSGAANIQCVFISPDNYSSLQGRIVNRDKIATRMIDAVALTNKAPTVADYFLLNINGVEGVERAFTALEEIIGRNVVL